MPQKMASRYDTLRVELCLSVWECVRASQCDVHLKPSNQSTEITPQCHSQFVRFVSNLRYPSNSVAGGSRARSCCKRYCFSSSAFYRCTIIWTTIVFLLSDMSVSYFLLVKFKLSLKINILWCVQLFLQVKFKLSLKIFFLICVWFFGG